MATAGLTKNGAATASDIAATASDIADTDDLGGASDVIVIHPLDIRTVALPVTGTAPYVQLRFSEKAKNAMKAKMAAGTTARSKNRAARDFDADYEAAMYRTAGGRYGIPAPAFRNALIDACRMAGFQMTKARCSLFVVADALDVYDGTPLVLIDGEPEKYEAQVRNATGVADIRIRAMWREWSATVTVSYDADQFRLSDVVNLLNRAGQQVGVGEGRPFSKKSAGLGFGQFRVSSSAPTPLP